MTSVYTEAIKYLDVQLHLHPDDEVAARYLDRARQRLALASKAEEAEEQPGQPERGMPPADHSADSEPQSGEL